METPTIANANANTNANLNGALDGPFDNRKAALDFFSSIREDDVVFHANVTHAIMRRPAPDQEVLKGKIETQLKDAHLAEMNNLRKEEDSAKNKMKEDHQKKITELEDEKRKKEGAIEVLEGKLASAEHRLDTEKRGREAFERQARSEAESRARKEHEEKIKLHESEEARLRADLQRLQIQLNAEKDSNCRFEAVLKDKVVDPVQKLVGPGTTPAEKGEKGEGWVAKMLADLKIHHEYVGSKNHVGDFHLWFERSDARIMVEVKNMTGVVPKNQRERFLEDLDRTSNVDAGLLFNTNGEAHPKKCFQDFSYSGGGKPVAYLSGANGDKRSLEVTLKFLLCLAEVSMLGAPDQASLKTFVDAQVSQCKNICKIAKGLKTDVDKRVVELLEQLQEVSENTKKFGKQLEAKGRKRASEGGGEGDAGCTVPTKIVKEDITVRKFSGSEEGAQDF